MSIAYISLGSNMGDKTYNIRQALDILAQFDNLTILSVSSFYQTEPEDYEDQDWFVNAAAQIETIMSSHELLQLFKKIEQDSGREKSIRWGPRKIDLDLLLYDQLCFKDSDLIVPHPRMHQRAFVLVPLAEIAANVFHPRLCKTIRTLLSELQNPKIVQKMN